MKQKRRRTRVTCLNTRNVPEDVKAQFKSYCARHGYTMEGAVHALLRRAISEDPILEISKKLPPLR